jgi:CBS domain-containing protein
VIGGLNLVLGVLSLLPGLPLDGGRVVRAIAWAQTHDRDRAGRITVRTGRLLGWSTVGVGVALAFMGEITAGLLILALGWLLATGARSLDRRLALENLLRGMRVDSAIRTDVPWVAPNLTIDTFADRFAGDARVPSLPVVDDERVVGVIGVKRLQRLGRRRFAATRAGDAMTTPPQAPFLAPDGDLWEAIDTMNQLGQEGLAAVDADGRLVGMLTRDSVGEVVRTRSAERAQAAAAAQGRG